MATFDTWDSYFYPDTYDGSRGEGTLRNLYEERDADVLGQLEYGDTADRLREIERGEVAIPRTFDAEHLQTIHRHVFQDVFEWAGQYRTVDMQKGMSTFADVDQIDRYLDDAHQRITSAPWANMDRNQFARAAADVFAHVNQAHPFREGNGRASKVFMQHVAELSPYRLEFSPERSGITPEIWNTASMLSGPDIGQHAPVPDSLVPVFEQLAQPRERGSPALGDDAAQLRAISRASYPRPATEAGRGGEAPGAAPKSPERYGRGNEGMSR